MKETINTKKPETTNTGFLFRRFLQKNALLKIPRHKNADLYVKDPAPIGIFTLILQMHQGKNLTGLKAN